MPPVAVASIYTVQGSISSATNEAVNSGNGVSVGRGVLVGRRVIVADGVGVHDSAISVCLLIANWVAVWASMADCVAVRSAIIALMVAETSSVGVSVHDSAVAVNLRIFSAVDVASIRATTARTSTVGSGVSDGIAVGSDVLVGTGVHVGGKDVSVGASVWVGKGVSVGMGERVGASVGDKMSSSVMAGKSVSVGNITTAADVAVVVILADELSPPCPIITTNTPIITRSAIPTNAPMSALFCFLGAEGGYTP